MKIGNREFDLKNHTYIMGILNVTPDSFSDGGNWQDMDGALRRAQEMLSEGADVIDVGGESTRPGYTPVSCEEEIRRTVPLIQRLKKELAPLISIDTCKPEVARAALDAGADMINDIWGFRHDPKMAKLAAKRHVPCCLMHNREKPEYEDLMEGVLSDLRESLKIAAAAGVKTEQILLDPGIGFGKNYEMNLEVLRKLDRISELGFPVLLGTSRKSVIGLTLGVPVGERLEGTIATTVYGVMKGCGFVRVHDVQANKRAVEMTEAILHGPGNRL